MLSTSNVPINVYGQYDRFKLTKERIPHQCGVAFFFMSAKRSEPPGWYPEVSVYSNTKKTIFRQHHKKRPNSRETILLFSEKIRYLPTAITKNSIQKGFYAEKTGNMFINSYNSIV